MQGIVKKHDYSTYSLCDEESSHRCVSSVDWAEPAVVWTDELLTKAWDLDNGRKKESEMNRRRTTPNENED
jgi:hypothetical protein